MCVSTTRTLNFVYRVNYEIALSEVRFLTLMVGVEIPKCSQSISKDIPFKINLTLTCEYEKIIKLCYVLTAMTGTFAPTILDMSKSMFFFFFVYSMKT